ARSGAWCVAADFSVGMLAAGGGRDVPKVAGDATRLPFADGVFDAVTISFGLRNVVDHAAGLREMARVTRPGGRLVVCEFSTPTNALFATAYKEYLMQALPRIARTVSSNPEAYVYLAESIRRDARPAARQIRATRSASSSVTRLPITRTAMCIRAVERIAIGPVNGRNRGNVSSS